MPSRRPSIAARAGLRPEYIAAIEKQFGFDKPPLERFAHDALELPALRFRQQLLPGQVGDRPRAREDAGLDHARPLDDAPLLRHLDTARHRQGRARRIALRCLDLGRHHRRLRAAGVPLRHPADRAVRRRQLLEHLPVARPHLGQLGHAALVAADPRLPLAHHAADRRHGGRRLRDHDAAHQELVPRRDPQAVRRHRSRQGPERAAACSTATSSATPCCW